MAHLVVDTKNGCAILRGFRTMLFTGDKLG